MEDNSRPLLSVRLVTYNHERFISQALDGILLQKTKFDFEVVIGDDGSTDGTPGVIADYTAKYPDLFHVLPNGHHLGARQNIMRTQFACNGKYVAHLDGDDYWTDPNKLQVQAEVLESHPEYSCCFHNMEVRYEDPHLHSNLYCRDMGKRVLTRMDLAMRNFIPASGNIFRNGLIKEYPEWYEKLPFGDWTWHLLNAQHGDIYYIPKVMGVYRNHANGLWSSNSPSEGTVRIIQALDIMIGQFDHDPAFSDRLKESRNHYAHLLHPAPPEKKSIKTKMVDSLIHLLRKIR